MLQQGQQRHRGEFLGDGAGQQAQEHGRGRFGQRFAGAVVGDHAVAQQLGGDAAGEVAVGRHQGGPGARRFQRVAQHQGDGGGFLLLVGGGRGGDTPSSGGGSPPQPGVQRGGGQQGAASVVKRSGRIGDGGWIGQGRTSPRVASEAVSKRRRPACGWESSSASQVSSSIAVSRAGSTTRPLRQPGDHAQQAGDGGDAGGGAGDQDRIVGGACFPGGGLRFSSATWRAAGFIRPFSAS